MPNFSGAQYPSMLSPSMSQMMPAKSDKMSPTIILIFIILCMSFSFLVYYMTTGNSIGSSLSCVSSILALSLISMQFVSSMDKQ